MKVYFHEDFYQVYSTDPASEPGRMEAVVKAIESEAEFIVPSPATKEQIAAVHGAKYIAGLEKLENIFYIASLAAGASIQAALTGLSEPCFALVRPPGHHASREAAWGFCYFNNIAIAVENLKNEAKIETAYILDIDMHFGDGTDNILNQKDYVVVHNIFAKTREAYIEEVSEAMSNCDADLIGISAGFDNHINDWGGLLYTGDYEEIGRLVGKAAKKSGSGCFAVLEGGYNHGVLGKNVLALMKGLATG